MRRGARFADFLRSLGALCADIDKGKPRPSYLIHGGHEYFREWAATNLLDHLLPGTSRQGGLRTVDYRQRGSRDLETLIAGEGNLFAPDAGRVILVKDPPLSRSEAKAFSLRFPADVPPGTVAIVISSQEVAAGSPLLKGLPEESAQLLAPSTESQQDGAAFLRFLATRNARSQVKADEGALQEVLVRVGTEDPRQLVREMEKLSLYVGPERAATRDDVRDITTPSAPESAFALLDQIAGGAPSQALTILNLLLEQRLPGPVVIAAIGHELRRLLQARAALDSGDVGPGSLTAGFDRFQQAFDGDKRVTIAGKFPSARRDNLFLQHPFVIYRCLQRAQSFSRNVLSRALETVVEADYELKTGAQAENQILEWVTLHLCETLATPATPAA